MHRQLQVLVIEGHRDQRTMIKARLAQMMPEGASHKVQQCHTVDQALCYLIKHWHEVDLIICHDTQPERVPTELERKLLVVVNCRPERKAETWRLMTCMSALDMDKPVLIGVVDRSSNPHFLKSFVDYHGPGGFEVCRTSDSDWENVRLTITHLAGSKLAS